MRIIYKKILGIIIIFAAVIGLVGLYSKNNSQKKIEERDKKVKNDMAIMADAQKKYRDLNGRYFLCGPFKGDGSCDLLDRSYPFGSMSPVLESIPSSESQWKYFGIDNANDPQQFCYYAKLADGNYYTASPKGNFQRSTRPWTFEECASTQNIDSPQKTANQKKEFTEHDNKRIADMDSLFETQKECYANKERYCPVVGRPNDGSPALDAGNENWTGKEGWRAFPNDPIGEGECGSGYLYCDLDNKNEPQEFCYYAKLEKGGFYVVSPKGGLKKDTAPLNFQDCRIGKAKSLKLISPVGGENWEAGKTYRIKWQSEAIDDVWISIVNEAQNAKYGGTENYISPGFKGVPAAVGYYDWTIDKNWIPGGDPAKYKIRISEYFGYESAVSARSNSNFTIHSLNSQNTAQNNSGTIYPVKAQKETCDNRPAIGVDSRSWFLQNDCPAWKIYSVTPDKPILLHVRSAADGCKYPTLSLSESNNLDETTWQNKGNLALNLAGVGMVNISYTPKSSYIKIDAKSCFYLNAYNNVPEILSQINPFDAIKYK